MTKQEMKETTGRGNTFVRCSKERFDDNHSADYEEGYYQLKENVSVFVRTSCWGRKDASDTCVFRPDTIHIGYKDLR
ncbi:MAG: hypothetical protein Q4A56_02325 [Porphyromonadaceae bacterium]|nr:hypothetical protein [Porphyromonadaceae bacterium]